MVAAAMALQLRSYQFNESIDPLTITVPLLRTVHGAIEGDGGPALLIAGDWSLPLPVEVTYTCVPRDSMPYTVGAGETVVCTINDNGHGIVGAVIAS
jgi:hypothetical protein